MAATDSEVDDEQEETLENDDDDDDVDDDEDDTEGRHYGLYDLFAVCNHRGSMSNGHYTGKRTCRPGVA